MSLDVTVGVKNAGFRTGLEQMRGQARQFAGSLKGMLAGAFSVTAIVAFADRMREIRNQALRLGTSAESVQRIGKAAKSADVDFEALAKSLNKVTLEAAKAARGDKAAGNIFERLHMDGAKFVMLPMEQKLIALSAAFERSRGSGDATAAMLELLGERGTEIIPLLAQGPKALAEGMKNAQVQSNATVRELANFSKQVEKIESQTKRWLGSFIGGLSQAAAWLGKLDPSKALGVLAGAVGGGVLGGTGTADNYKETAETLLTQRHQLENEKGPDGAAAKKRNRAKIDAFAEKMRKRDNGVIEKGEEEAEAKAEKKPANDFDPKSADATKLATLKQSIAEEEAKNRVDALTGEARINELMEQRKALASQINDDTEEGLEAKKRDLALEHELSAVQKQQKEAMDRAEKAEATELEKQYLDKATPKEKKKYLEDKKARLMKESQDAEIANDPVKATEKRTEAEALQPEIDQAGKKGKGGDRLTVSVDSLQRAGGGGGIGPASDPAQRSRDKQTELLKQIKDALTQKATVTVRDSQPLY